MRSAICAILSICDSLTIFLTWAAVGVNSSDLASPYYADELVIGKRHYMLSWRLNLLN
jgi:hypothetical protein